MSLEQKLDEILNNRREFLLFRHFLNTVICAPEALLFIESVDILKVIIKDGNNARFRTDLISTYEEQFEYIVDTFLTETSSYYLNLNSDELKSINNDIKRNKFDPKIFDGLYESQKLMLAHGPLRQYLTKEERGLRKVKSHDTVSDHQEKDNIGSRIMKKLLGNNRSYSTNN